jgi:ATP-dependent Lon protease
MTGEVTITGEVLPIGGLRGKVLAAERAGIFEVIVPAGNEDDLLDIPADVAGRMTFHLVDHASQVLEVVGIDGRGPVNERPARPQSMSGASAKPDK